MIYEIKTVNGVKTKVPLTGNGYGLPLGTWISYEGNCPDGFIESEQTFNTTTYASLYAMLGTNKVPARFDHSVLSDYEDIQSSVPITLQNGVPLPKADSYIVPYDGFITLGGNGNPYNLVLFVNGEVGMSFYGTNGAWSTPVKKGDYVSISSGTTISSVKARYYKRHLAIKATPAYVEPDTVSDMVNTLRTQDSYSTEEVNTGKKWIDGKPIYRKVIPFFRNSALVTGWTQSASNEWSNSAIPNIIDTVVCGMATSERTSGWVDTYVNDNSIGITVHKSLQKIWAIFITTVYKADVIIEYTKTTD